MDDLLLNSLQHGHLKYLRDLLEALFKSSFKISPKECQLFRPKVQYLGNSTLTKYFNKGKISVLDH